ncbi:MAG: hypothetical protein JNJ83_06670 [Verrucomicrobiaceae bacterium]|nr:hypothetical protein [Verrucomicrobiaceae bacterium]
MHRLLALLFVGMALSGLRADESDIRRDLERVYSDWRAALLAKSVEAWTRSTCAYRQMFTRNAIVSQGKVYPDSLFDLPFQPPSVIGLQLVEVEAVGDTAHLLYFGRIDLGLEAEKIPENLMMLKFYKDAGAWKFDTTRYFNLGNDDDTRRQIRAGTADFYKHPPFNPPGVAPAVPKPCNKPEKVGALRIHAIGYEVVASMNGYDYPPVADDAEQQLIIGGLVRGDNKLQLTIKQLPLPKDDPSVERHLEVQAVMATEDLEKPTLRVFRWKPSAHPAPDKVELNVRLDIRTMKGV